MLDEATPPVRRLRDVAPVDDAPATRSTGLDPTFWYPVARSRELKSGATVAVKFAGSQIVLVRPETGVRSRWRTGVLTARCR
jgi:hypothetical protein